MPVLIDTNILLRAAQPAHPMHATAVRAMAVLMKSEDTLGIALQNAAEFWNAATRPEANNGLGFTIEEAQEELTRFEGFFQILSENAASYAAWKALLIANRVSVMKTHGVERIITFNVSDFARFSGIEAVHPDAIT